MSEQQSSKTPLPEGTIPVAVGLIVSGVTIYAFFKVGQLALGKEDFKPLVALWFTTFALVPGVFMPVEQELGRALAHRRALDSGGRPIVRRMVPLAAGLLGVLIAVIIAFSPWLTKDMFEGNGIVTVCLILTFCGYAPMHVARGIASGSGRFVSYGLAIGTDGAIRLAACIALWVAGVDSIGAYALVIAVSPLVATAVVVAHGGTHTSDGPHASFAEVTPNLGWLLLGSIMAAGLVNAGPLGVDVLAHADDAAKVTAFGNGVLLSRIPLFLFQAVQAALLPRLARLAAKGDLDEFKRGLSLLMKVVAVVAVTGVVGSFAIGPWALDLVYEGGLDRRTLTLLALASGLYMLATALAQAVIALQGHKFVSIGWMSSMATFVVVTALAGDDLFLRVESGLVAASACALVMFALSYRARVSAGAVPSADSMIDGIIDTQLDA